MIQTGPPPRGDGAFSPARRLAPADAAVFETHVVPRYLSLFGDRMIEMIAGSSDARVCHVHCRTDYPDRDLLAKLPNARNRVGPNSGSRSMIGFFVPHF